MPIHKFDKSALSTDVLYNFRTAFSVVVSFLETPETDHDQKAALYLNVILTFDFIIALLFAEHILSSTVTLINYLQKRDIDFLEAVTHLSQSCNLEIEPMKGVMFLFGEICLIHSACEIESEFEIEVSRPCVVGRQRSSRTSSDYWRISLCFVFLDHLVEEILK